MVDLRNVKSIAERYDLDWQRYPNRWLRWRWRAGWACALLGLVCVAVPFVTNDHRPFLSRSVCEPHRYFEHQCGSCHDRRWQPLLRLVTGNDNLTSTSSVSCGKCHTQSVDDHHAQTLREPLQVECAHCHQEHRGRSLVEVADEMCVRCHGNLQHHRRSGEPEMVENTVVSWKDHPEFAVKRQPRPGYSLEAIVAELATADEREGRWRDKTVLRFNHRVHLHPDGVPVPPGHPEFGDGRTWKKLHCQDCHVPDVAGQAMQPIRYEAHCAPCHRLEFSFALALDGPLPHGDADLVRGVLRQRLTEQLFAHPELLQATNSAPLILPNTPTDNPSQPMPPDATLDAQRWQWVESRLRELCQQVQVPAALPIQESPTFPGKRIQTGCRYCHEVTRQMEPDWQVVSPGIPRRWMPMAEFSHRTHTMVACQECHYDGVDRRLVVSDSQLTADVCMPSKQVCQKCHIRSGRGPVSGSAGSRCVDCHRYHGRSREMLRREIR